MELPIFEVNAFVGEGYLGNPAAVCPLERWLDEAQMQAIAAQNNLSETAFFVAAGEDYDLRWFTPETEVDLCGHATLASGHIVLERLRPGADAVRFQTRSGPLGVSRDDGRFVLELPSLPGEPCDPPEDLVAGLGVACTEILRASNYLAVLESEAVVVGLAPDMQRLAALHPFGVIVTAPGDEVDFVSRFFGPSFGIPEDPVTGSAHCTLAPYWSRRLGKTTLEARQLSRRGGEIVCQDLGERVAVAGRSAIYLEGKIFV